MWSYLVRRLWQMIPTLLGVVLFVFFLFKRFGADPAQTLASLNATPRQIAEIRAQLGLDDPWWVQLGIFLKGIVTINDLAHHLQSARTAEGVEPAKVAGTLAAISRPRSVSSVRSAP